MKLRQTDPAPIAAAKSGFSSSSAYRIEKDLRLPSQRKVRRDAAAPIRSPMSGRVRSCRSSRRRQGCGRSPFRGGSAAPSRARRGCAPDPGASDPRLARHRRPGPGGRLSPGPRTGAMGLSDFTEMGDLAVTIAGTSLDHRLYHFRLAYSGFEHAHVILGGESYVALAEGLQNASGRSAARRWNIAATACRPLSAISARIPKTIRPDATMSLCSLWNDAEPQQHRRRARERLDREAHGHLKRVPRMPFSDVARATSTILPPIAGSLMRWSAAGMRGSGHGSTSNGRHCRSCLAGAPPTTRRPLSP